MFPAADFADKLNVMVMSGDKLPDMIFCGGIGTNNVWVEEGAVIELTEYYGNPDLSRNITAAIEENEKDILKYAKNADGELYGLVTYDGALGDQWNKLWIYEP